MEIYFWIKLIILSVFDVEIGRSLCLSVVIHENKDELLIDVNSEKRIKELKNIVEEELKICYLLYH